MCLDLLIFLMHRRMCVSVDYFLFIDIYIYISKCSKQTRSGLFLYTYISTLNPSSSEGNTNVCYLYV